MEAGNQLKLLLWKDGLVRKRHLGVATLVFGWAIAVFLILYIVRESIDPEYSPTCQYTARSLPSTGLFPFVQSFICNIDNKCNNINQYEEVPQYANARLTGVAKQLETAFTNETISKVLKKLPDMLLLLKTIGRGLDSPDLVGIFGPGIKIENLFDNTAQLKRDIKNNNPKLDVETLDVVFNSNLKLGHLLNAFGETDLQYEICTPSELEKYLILPENGDIEAVSKNLCNIEVSDVPNLLQRFFDNADFSGLLESIGNIAENFSNYNVFDDIKKIVEIILSLNSVKENIPKNLKLKLWLPDVITEMKSMNKTHFDANFIDQSLQIIEPHFKDTNLWIHYKTLIKNITNLLQSLQNKILAKGLVIRNTGAGPSNFSDFVDNLQKNIEKYQNPTKEDLLKKQNLLFEMLHDTLNVFPAFYTNGSKPWIYIANILDSLKPIVNNKVLNSVSMISNVFAKAVTSLFNTIKGEQESEQILYDLCQKHSNTVSTLFSLGPDFITSMLNCFENITCTSVIVENQKNMSKIFCDKDMIEYILPEASSIKNIGILCNFDLGSFIEDLNTEFNLGWINKTLTDLMENNYYKAESNTSFYDAVKNTEEFVKYLLERPNIMEEKLQISWEQLLPDIENTEWKNLVVKAKKNTGLYMVNIQLSYIQYFLLQEDTLHPIFNASTSLMEGLITQYQLIPKQLIKNVINNLPAIIENFLHVFTNKTQIITLTSIDDWEQYFCNQSVFLPDLNKISKIICEQVTFLKTQSNRPWFEHPLTATLNDIIKKYPNNTDFDLNRFVANGQQLYFLISDVLNIKWPTYKWDGEIFTSDYWVKWAKAFDLETAMHFSIQILTKIADEFESSFYSVQPQENLNKMRKISASAYTFIIFVFDNIDFALDIENNSTDTQMIFPKTYNLSQMIINNLENLIIDFNKYGEQDDEKVSQLIEWFEQPCDKNVEMVFEKALVESRATLSAIQNVICNSKDYSEEWKIREDANKTWGPIPWNKVASRFTKLIHDLPKSQAKKNSISEDEKEINIIHNAILFEKSVFKILDTYLEDKLMRKETLHQLWIQLNKCNRKKENCFDLEVDIAKHTSKFIASAVAEFTNGITEYIKTINSTEGVDPLRLIGFSNTSKIYKIYSKFPDFIKVFVHSYRLPEFERKIFEKRSVGKPVSCADVMSYLEIPENNAVFKDDINDLQKYLCPSIFEWPVMKDNLFLLTISKIQDIYLETPVSKYRTTYSAMAQNLFDFKVVLMDMLKYGKVNISELWNNIWTNDMKKTFEEIRKTPFNSENTITRYFKYIDKPTDKFMLSPHLINPKYGFGDFAYLFKQINFMLSNYTSSNLTAKSEAADFKDLIEVYQKQITGLFSYIYIRFADEDFITGFNHFCNSTNELSELNIFMPNWMLKDDDKIIDKLCQYSEDEFKNSLISIEKLDIKNYNVVLEEIILQFLTTLNNFVDNKNEIHISDLITKHLDLKNIFNMSFPTDEELRNSSLQKAHELSDTNPRNVANIDETLKITSSLLKILQGGDWWDSLLNNFKDPTITFWLRLLEKSPHIILHMADAAISPHLLFDITSKVVTQGPIALCDNTNFDLSKYVYEESIVSIVHEFCDMESKTEENKLIEIQVNETFYQVVVNENIFANDIENLQKSLIQLVKEGNKPFILPKWMDEKVILKEYTDYATKNKNPLKLLQTVTTILNEIIDIGSVFYKNETENCTWCTWSTILVRETSAHLSKAQKYAEFLCEIPKMNFTQIRVALVEEFKWGQFFKDLTGNRTYTVEDFNREIHDIVEVIRVQLITFFTNKSLQNLPQKCLKSIAEAPALKNITTYISAVKEIISTIKSSSVTFLNSPMFEFSSSNISNAIEKHIPILKPFDEVLDEAVSQQLLDLNINNKTVIKLLNAKVDINTLSKVQNKEDIHVFLSDKIMFHKLFTFDNLMDLKEIYFEVNHENVSAVSGIIFNSLKRIVIEEKIKTWREDAMKSLKWVTNIFENLEHVVLNGGSLLEFISTVDFNSLTSGNVNISEMLKGILDLLNKNSIEKLFQSLKDLVKSSAPLIQNKVIENDLYNVLDGIEDLNIFKNLGLLRIRYNVSKVVENWHWVDAYLIYQIHLEQNAVNDILTASIDLSQIMASQGDGLNLRQMFCSPDELSKLIKFNSDNPQKSAEKISSQLCDNITISEIQNIALLSFKNINISKILEMIMNTTITTILTSAHMTEAEGKEVIDSIGEGATLLPYLRTMIANVSKDLSMLSFDHFKSEKLVTAEVISPDLLSSASTLLCGRPLVQNTNKLYQVISETIDYNADKYDEMEQKTLPSKFCRNLYKDITHMPAGKVIWAYIKPLIRGKILYTPNIPIVENILKNANTTFKDISDFQDILIRITDALETLEDREDMEHNIDNIEKFMNSSMVQMAARSMLQLVTNQEIDFSDFNLKTMLNSFGDSNTMSSALKFGRDFLQCVLLNRFIGMDSEEELEEEAKKLMETNEFIAGIVFTDLENRIKRSVDELPRDISYKIRMDIDSVPSTNYLKYKFWTPGPENDFLDELRYFRGFIQLQDLIDNSIIKLRSPDADIPKWDILTQEMPYSCYTRDFFKSALTISQTFQVCFFFGLIAVVAAAVRYIVWEKESGNTMVMNVMGLKYITHCMSWFLVTFLEMLFVMICILIILKAGRIIVMSDALLLFLYLIDFGFSLIMFCYMISSMFNSASLAAVGSAIFYLLSFMPYIIIISLETSLPFWAKMLTNLSMSTSFCYGCLYLIRFELQGVGMQWHNAWQTPVPGDTMNFGMTCIFLLFDGILYGVIGYLCSRKSQELHTMFKFLPSWFFTNTYNCGTAGSYTNFSDELYMRPFMLGGENYLDETVSRTNLINDEPLKIGVTIKSLTKIYNSRKKTVKAIEDIDITLYTGQVTTLLGHNGAGKTTLIKILTGMMQPTSGKIIINSEITEQGNEARFLGVCPQASVLIDTMSPLEHLIFYARLKTGRKRNEVMNEVVEMIDSLSLDYLSNEPVNHLSEGMRRRLCVAIAFIGKPRLVVLDEPSSGVDPVARRQVWDLVIRYKEGCTVLLTTHYLDEAELLSDRVVVLHKGKVLCSGSPLILKQSYGSGYRLTVTYPEDKQKKEINDGTLEMLMPVVNKPASNATLSEIRKCEIDVIVPFNSNEGVPNNFEAVALALEDNQYNLGFSTYSMNCSTLEEIFLDLCSKADLKDSNLSSNYDRISQLGRSYSNIFSSSEEIPAATKDEDILLNTGEKLTGGNVDKFFALLKKRAIHCMYDWRVIICALVLPTLFTAVAMGFSLIRPPNSNEPSLKLSPELYHPHTTSFISVDTNDMTSFINRVSKEIVGISPNKNLELYTKTFRDCVCTNGMQQCQRPSNSPNDALLKLYSANETMEWLIETQNEYIEQRYGGWSLSEQASNKSAMIIWYNNKGYHSMPSYLNTMNTAILRTISPGSKITTYNHPLKLSVDQLSKSSIAQHIADVGIAMVLLIAFSLIPASGSIYLVQERVNEEKRLQFLCGVSPTLYWLVAFIWDMIVLLFALLLAVIVFKIFGLPVYTARENMAAVSLLIFLYGWACIPFIHLTQRLFNDASMANMILFCVCTFIGIAELTCLLLMDILGTTQFVADFRIVLHKIYLIFPQFVLGDGLVEISKNNIQSEILQRFHMDTYTSPLSWDLMGLHYLSLALMGIILFMVNLIIENEWFRSFRKPSTIYPSDASCLEIVNLIKIYNNTSGKHVAVNDINLKVPFGECLGLIGVNGAGKSTTFKMLTTELRATSGRIFLQGREICRKPLYTGEMGYCAQCDSLDPKLTVKQTLNLYLTLRGIVKQNDITYKIMTKFELNNYANRRTENLSGGNKRKLCTALSVLGKTALILMDEPTSGMDPTSRNLVATTIQQLTKANRSVILTSHSVEDCEALCSDIAVMINGKIICQGSPKDLKERYGSGYIISVRLAKPSEQDLLLELMKKEFPGCELMTRQYCSSQFSVPTDKTKISDMFKQMTKISEYVSVEDFNLVQSSLDQVFINLANRSETSNGLEEKLPNMYSMEVI